MTKLKLLSAALIATAMIATPAMARQSHITSRHLVEDANASTTPGAPNSDERNCHLALGERAPLRTFAGLLIHRASRTGLVVHCCHAPNPTRYRSGANATPLE